jgi:hypothetical protein
MAIEYVIRYFGSLPITTEFRYCNEWWFKTTLNNAIPLSRQGLGSLYNREFPDGSLIGVKAWQDMEWLEKRFQSN